MPNTLGVSRPRSAGARAVPLLDQLPGGWRQRRTYWNYITAKRLVLVIERSVGRGARWVVFEPNDESLTPPCEEVGQPNPPRTRDRRDRGSAAAIHQPTRRTPAEPWARPVQTGRSDPAVATARKFWPLPSQRIETGSGDPKPAGPPRHAGASRRLERTFRSATQGDREAPLSQETRPASRCNRARSCGRRPGRSRRRRRSRRWAHPPTRPRPPGRRGPASRTCENRGRCT